MGGIITPFLLPPDTTSVLCQGHAYNAGATTLCVLGGEHLRQACAAQQSRADANWGVAAGRAQAQRGLGCSCRRRCAACPSSLARLLARFACAPGAPSWLSFTVPGVLRAVYLIQTTRLRRSCRGAQLAPEKAMAVLCCTTCACSWHVDAPSHRHLPARSWSPAPGTETAEELLQRAASSGNGSGGNGSGGADGAAAKKPFDGRAFRRSLGKTGRYQRNPINDPASLALMEEHGVGYSSTGLIAQMRLNGNLWQQGVRARACRTCRTVLSSCARPNCFTEHRAGQQVPLAPHHRLRCRGSPRGCRQGPKRRAGGGSRL